MSFDPKYPIVCAALQHPDAGYLILGVRHFDPHMRAAVALLKDSISWKTATQGFVNSRGEFLTREEALYVARAHGQIRKRCGGDETQLFSENLY